jgi:glycogen phosphorylase/synthase
MSESLLKPDYLFETSWEVCNKVGGIHTVISTKALTLVNELKDNYILIGPDVWRDATTNPEFVEDANLFKSWRDRAAEEGLHIKIGNWNIAGRPIVIIVDFKTFISQKDDIFKTFWERFKLDSLSGQWDYVEPALFGWAAAKVIESFTKYNLSFRHKIVAQFHEWMTGTGLLYLKQNVPQVGTIFTTHATVIGRSVAGNQLPLYSKLKEFDGDAKALDFNVTAKQSLEKLAAQNADCFTTVSELTGKECSQFLKKDIDLVTPNGFEDSFLPPPEKFDDSRKLARQKFLEVANALLDGNIKEDAFLVGIGGRYEFKNKGIDLLIDSLGRINTSGLVNKQVVAFILIPANHYGPRKDLLNNLNSKEHHQLNGLFLTHNLHEAEYDPILNRLKKVGITNDPGDKVKAIFVPCYLNGNDEIFNLHYYELLIGLDLGVFPSYYEPWGYTPLESLAFHVPTVTTSLTGFGLWVRRECKECNASNDGITVLERTDTNDVEVEEGIARKIVEMAGKLEPAIFLAKENASAISKIALWKNLIIYYEKAFDIALSKVELRASTFQQIEQTAEPVIHLENITTVNQPVWRKLLIQKNIPEKLKALDDLSKNIWWSWNYDAVELFEEIDSDTWKECNQNPIDFLDHISYNKFLKLENNKAFLEKMNSVYNRFMDYMAQKANKKSPKVAYFSMEYGLHDSLKIYSGGLGILAGDYLKEASDRNFDIVGIGLLYKYGYFTQVISNKGNQIATYEAQEFGKAPVTPVRDKDGNWLKISVVLPGRTMHAHIWKAEVGRVDLYLLDTDFEENLDQDKSVTHQLYGGGDDNRIKQEILLGIGGIRAIRALGIEADLYHCNEGHAAFIGLERLNNLIIEKNLSFNEAVEIVRSSSLFTTHTPVPAGHDSFHEDLIRIYLGHYPARLKINWAQFMNLGKVNPNDQNERFSMSFLAANLSQEINGVSRLHGKVSQYIFNGLWKGYLPEELHIGYVTNGVHLPTWTAKEWISLYEREFGKDFVNNQTNKDLWNKIYDVPDKEIWKIRNNQRRMLIDYIKDRLDEASNMRTENPKYIVEVQEKLSKFSLTIGFARRFATYKRAHLLFRDLDRLARIVNNPGMPVQFIYAGKAHPNDKAGQDLIKYIIDISKRPEFMGKIIFLPNYDMELAKKLVQGVDIWLNTPTRPLEASGTSGEKAVMNGVLHFSVLDGWWAEGYQPNSGWALTEKQTYIDENFQDELDAETIYSLLENEIAPLFYFREIDDVPNGWVRYIKNSISKVASNFTMNRMLDDYNNRFYKKLYEREKKVAANDFEVAIEIATWKKKISRAWESIEVLSVKYPDVSQEDIILAKKYGSEVVLDLNEINPSDVGVELVIASFDKDESKLKIIFSQEFELVKTENKIAHYKIEVVPTKPGIFDLGVRIFPKNPLLPHRQDLNYIKWI